MKLYDLARSYFPRNLPVGATEFNEWSDRIIALAGQFADADSMKFALASSVMHLDSTKGSMPDQYFVRLMRKAAANQVAAQFFQDIKLKQQIAQEAAAKAATEAAANASVETLNVQTETK